MLPAGSSPSSLTPALPVCVLAPRICWAFSHGDPGHAAHMPLHTLLFSLAKPFSAPMATLPYRTTPAPACPYPPRHYAITLGLLVYHWWPQPHPRLWNQVFLSSGPRGRDVFGSGFSALASLLQPPLGLSLCSRLLYLLVSSPELVLVVLTWFSQKLTPWTSLIIQLISGLISPWH